MTQVRWSRALATMALLGLLLAAGLAVTAQSDAAERPRIKACSTKSFKYPDRKLGGYFTQLRVRGTSCSNGRKVARAYYSCRRKSGVEGMCKAKTVRRYRCKETRRSRDKQEGVSYSATVTCRRGKYGYIRHRYQQNLGE
jgi:hypothetical protein